MPARRIRAAIPSVDFYGDAESWPMSELLHSEPLAERSQRYNWRISPHRHDALTQLFLLLEGSGTARLDSVTYELTAANLLIIPQRCVHEFDWSSESQGFVLSIAAPLVERLERNAGSKFGMFSEPRRVSLGDDREYLATLVRRINEEAAEPRLLQEMALESLMQILTIWLARSSPPVPGKAASRAARHYQRFARLVDQHHKEHWSVADYSRQIGITASHLNSISRQVASRSALRIINDRLTLAARRDLTYTDRPVAIVAQRLGFTDPSYFARFFKRETGLTPVEFRRHSGTTPAH